MAIFSIECFCCQEKGITVTRANCVLCLLPSWHLQLTAQHHQSLLLHSPEGRLSLVQAKNSYEIRQLLPDMTWH